jgi:hypothetical protein
MNNATLPAPTHSDCSHNYGGERGQTGLAHITVAYFVAAGLVHKAVRFWRHDYLKAGRIEIYTIEPYHAEGTTCTELGWALSSPGDFLRYANEIQPSRVDLEAMSAIQAASKGTYSSAHVAQAARYAAMEL